jgi:phage-related protein
VAALFTSLGGIEDGIGSAIQAVGVEIDGALGDAAQAIELIAGKLEELSSAATEAGTEATTLLSSLQNALSTAQSLLPGGPSTSALESGSQFFGMLSSLLSEVGSITEAIITLHQIAQELRAIGSALKA